MNDILFITVSGIIIVFSVLLILMFVFLAMKLFSKEKKSEIKKEPVKKIEKIIEKIENSETSESYSEEIVAAISAAITSYTGNSDFVIRNINPVNNNIKFISKSRWNQVSPLKYWAKRK
ncbi:MAG: OadG family protein [Thermotogae bacterium]|nr:OadG family protein [Thermotogota bacterium]HOO75339.1 OadG family transporter subunit [Tepiditoga sp.]